MTPWRSTRHYSRHVSFQAPSPPSGAWLTTSQIPGYQFKVRVTAGTAITGVEESDCIPETLCVSASVPGRSEVLIRIVGPKPNGFLWPNVTKFNTSQVEVWAEQLSTGSIKYYVLPGAWPGLDTLPGLYDRRVSRRRRLAGFAASGQPVPISARFMMAAMGTGNVYFDLTEELNAEGGIAVLASGQAVVFYKISMMSKDGDWILRETPEASYGQGSERAPVQAVLAGGSRDAVVVELARELRPASAEGPGEA